MATPLAEAIRFVRRVYRLRMLGLGLGVLCAGAVLYEQRAGPIWWILLFVNGYVWPHLAYWRARRAAAPENAERENLVIDSAFGGFWIAVMAFNALPSALYVTMLGVDKIAVGGPRLWRQAVISQALATLVTSAALGFPFAPATSMEVVLACLPFMVSYPTAIGLAAYTLAHTVRRQNRLLDELNRIDSLTGLPNRKHWNEAVAVELRRHHRNGRPAALLMLDVDHFKLINDEYGHAAGDTVLRCVADVLRRCVRDIDTPGRFGGDEFGVVLAETTATQAAEIAERIRSLVATETRLGNGLPGATVSVGVATASPVIGDLRMWMEAADAALYAAKHAGRNRVEPLPAAAKAALAMDS
ncbi:diguanylate cyclase [Tahibacter amnicola]|uniref:diguanylate cyclase n=1 Tax=Tahibacter amnicola TaxID=2976241 RepID=A0ABY6BI86_9GAMM|nr:diguanylate cyclase [Tahibacter amnicola]UXI69058.1 diguanylate cyclase [Tahibacter amnicola]